MSSQRDSKARSSQEKRSSGTRRKSTHGTNSGGKSSSSVKVAYRNPRDAKWDVDKAWVPTRRLATPEMNAARKLFNDLDRDGSGSIDADELAIAMRQLGQSPTDEEIRDLIKSVDEGGAEADGQIQLREFLKLYSNGLDTKDKACAPLASCPSERP